MKHLQKLSKRQHDAVRKFLEYDASIMVGSKFNGVKANWKDLVHTRVQAYTDANLQLEQTAYLEKMQKLATLNAQRTKDNLVLATDSAFIAYDGANQPIVFTNEECYDFLCAAEISRNELYSLKANEKEILKINRELSEMEEALKTPEQKIADMKKRRDELLGITKPTTEQ